MHPEGTAEEGTIFLKYIWKIHFVVHLFKAIYLGKDEGQTDLKSIQNASIASLNMKRTMHNRTKCNECYNDLQK